jgi:hypothetical protein
MWKRVELPPLSTLIRRSAGGSGSRSAESGASASSLTSSNLSPNASINWCKNTYLDLKGDLLDSVLGGLPRCGVNEDVGEEEGVYPKMRFFKFIVYAIPDGLCFIIKA